MDSHSPSISKALAFPFFLLAFALMSWVLLRFQFKDVQASFFFLAFAGLVVYVTTLINVQFGIAVMIFATSVSPKVAISGFGFTIEDFIIPVVFFAWITRIIERKEELNSTNLKTPILAYLFVTGLATLVGAVLFPQFNGQNATVHYFKYMQYFLVFWISMNNIYSYRQARAYITGLIIICGIASLTSITIFSTQGAPDSRIIGATGSNPNTLGGLYCMMFLLLLSVLLSARTIGIKLLILCVLALLAHPLIFSLSRTTWAAIIVGVVLLGVFRDKRVLILATVALLVIYVYVPDFVKHRADELTKTVAGVPADSWTARVESWERIWPAILESPVIGHGKGTLDLARADNEYILQLHEAGGIGILLFLLILYRIMQTARRLSIRLEDPILRGFSRGMFVSVIALAVHAVAATTFTTVKIMTVFYFCVGILYALQNLYDREKSMAERFSKGYVELTSAKPVPVFQSATGNPRSR